MMFANKKIGTIAPVYNVDSSPMALQALKKHFSLVQISAVLCQINKFSYWFLFLGNKFLKHFDNITCMLKAVVTASFPENV